MSLIIRINGDLNISGAVDYGRILFLFFFYAGHFFITYPFDLRTDPETGYDRITELVSD